MKIVPFEGSKGAKIYVVGEAPGRQEEIEGRPFVGGAGRLLNRLLMEVGLIREECRLGNVMRVRPRGNQFKEFYVRGKLGGEPTPELVEGREYLLEDIKRTRPNVVCAMGNEALHALIGQRGITNWRGSVVWSQKARCKVLATIHPANLLRMWNHLPLVLFDLRRLKEESEKAEIDIPKYKLVTAPSFVEVMEEIERVKKCEKVTVDTETDEKLHITAVSIADTPFSAISIPFTRGEGVPYWTVEDEESIWLALKEMLEDERVGKWMQNGQFDLLVFRINPFHIKVRNFTLDTMCAFHTLYPELRKRLGVLTSIYTRHPYYKHWARSGNDMQFWRYSATDAAVTYESGVGIVKEMEEFGVTEFYYEMVHPLIEVLTKVHLRGVKVDDEVRRELKGKAEEKVEVMQAKLEQVVGRKVNVMSPSQLKELLYSDLRLPPKYKRGTRKITTDEEALKSLAKKFRSPVFDLILNVREQRKLIGTYLEKKVDDDGRFRTSYVIGGTETGRLSSSESVFGSGGNLQNIPRGDVRRMFVADEGKVFVEADLSQAEARVVAYLAEEQRLIDLLEKREGDVHKQNAAWIYSKDVGDVSEEERTTAKRLVHASNYGIGKRAFAYRAGVNEKMALALLQKYYDVFPHIKAWHMRIRANLSKHRTLTTPLGRKRTFFGRWGESLFREAYAFVPQSTVGDLLNYAIIKMCRERPDVEVMLQVHDSVVIQCERGEMREWVGVLEKAFDVVVVINGRDVKIPIEVKSGKNWGEMEVIDVSD